MQLVPMAILVAEASLEMQPLLCGNLNAGDVNIPPPEWAQRLLSKAESAEQSHKQITE